MDRRGKIVDVLDQEIVLCAGAGDADRIAFLKSVRSDQTCRHLAGEADERNGVHKGILQRRDRICNARSRCHQHDANSSCRAGIAFGGVSGPLLMAHQEMFDVLLLEDFVIDRQHRCAGITENVFDAVVAQRLQNDLAAVHATIRGIVEERVGCLAGHIWVPS